MLQVITQITDTNREDIESRMHGTCSEVLQEKNGSTLELYRPQGKPPVLVTADMVEGMSPGSVIVDMAAETGGNVEGSIMNEVVDINGVKVVGQGNLPGEVARNASDMYSNNLLNLVMEFWDSEAKTLNLDPEDEIIAACVITRDGAVVNETIKNIYSGG